jgi:hypothetical protein
MAKSSKRKRENAKWVALALLLGWTIREEFSINGIRKPRGWHRPAIPGSKCFLSKRTARECVTHDTRVNPTE